MASNIVALITGASRGLGLQLARSLLLKENFHVVATCRNPSGAEELQALQVLREHSAHLIQFLMGE